MEWKKGAVIGRGSFSTVNLAVIKPHDNSLQYPAIMAVKSAPLSNSSSLRYEKSVLEDLQGCPRIIHCFGDEVKFDTKSNSPHYNLFLEYFAGGSLYDIFCRSNRSLKEDVVQRCTHSILEGLRYVHSKGYVHCDIKPQNILVHNEDCFDVKIADFGLAKRTGEKTDKSNSVVIRGTPLYISPEAFSRGEYDCPADIWALGCLVLEMLSGRPPWQCDISTNWSLVMRIGYGDELPEIPQDLSSEAKDFLSQCLVKNPSNRATAEMLLQHPFVSVKGNTATSIADSVICDDKRTSLWPSPRNVFEFSEWGSLKSADRYTCSSLKESVQEDFHDYVVAANRIKELAVDEMPQWSYSSSIDCGWIDVRVCNNASELMPEPRDCLVEKVLDSAQIFDEMQCRYENWSVKYSDIMLDFVAEMSSTSSTIQLTLPEILFKYNYLNKFETNSDTLSCTRSSSLLGQPCASDISTCSLRSSYLYEYFIKYN